MEKKVRISRYLMLFLLCLIAAAVLIFFPLFLTAELDKVTCNTLAETSIKNADIVSFQLTSQHDLAVNLAKQIDASVAKNDAKAAIDSLGKIDMTGALARYGFAYLNGECYYKSVDGVGVYSHLPKVNYIDYAISSKKVTVKRLIPEQSLDSVDTFTMLMPVFKDGEPIGVFFLSYHTEDIRKFLGSSSFNGEEHFAIISKNGEIIVSATFDALDEKNVKNVFDYISDTGKDGEKNHKQFIDDISNNRSGIIKANNIYKNNDYYISYAPIDFEDWYIISYIPQSVVNTSRNTVLTYIALMCFFLIGVFILFALYIVTEEKAKKKEIDQILYIDSLTGGSSYAKFCVDAKKQLVKSNNNIAYIVMDIDRFKLVNDYYGYEHGNKTLRYIYSLWEELLNDGEHVCRIAADRFAVLMHYKSKEELSKRINEFSQRCHKYYDGTTMDYILTPSIGIYLVEKGETNLQRLQTKAVMAKSLVKGHREESFAFYDKSLKQTLSEKKALEDELDLAIENKTLDVIFQPQFDTVSQKICGAEALVRWRRDNGSFVPPDEFIALAEERGLIQSLDQLTFEAVCKRQAEWSKSGLHDIDFSVNLSQKSLVRENFAENCEALAKKMGADVNHLQLEITETTLFKSKKMFIKLLRQIRKTGFKILMDDFGTGYSSLMLLKSMPIDILKLDKSFIDDYDDPRGRSIIECVIEMAKRLKIKIIAEGVETEEQFRYLRDFECDMIQGYFFGKPMTFEQLQELVREEYNQDE